MGGSSPGARPAAAASPRCGGTAGPSVMPAASRQRAARAPGRARWCRAAGRRDAFAVAVALGERQGEAQPALGRPRGRSTRIAASSARRNAPAKPSSSSARSRRPRRSSPIGARISRRTPIFGGELRRDPAPPARRRGRARQGSRRPPPWRWGRRSRRGSADSGSRRPAAAACWRRAAFPPAGRIALGGEEGGDVGRPGGQGGQAVAGAPGAPGAHPGAVGAPRVVRLGVAGEDVGGRAVRSPACRRRPGSRCRWRASNQARTGGRRRAERRVGLGAVGRREAGQGRPARPGRRRRPARRAGRGTRSSAGAGAARRTRRLDDRGICPAQRRRHKTGRRRRNATRAVGRPAPAARGDAGLAMAGRRAAADWRAAQAARAVHRPPHAAAPRARPTTRRRRRAAERCHASAVARGADQRRPGPRRRAFSGSWRRIAGRAMGLDFSGSPYARQCRLSGIGSRKTGQGSPPENNKVI